MADQIVLNNGDTLGRVLKEHLYGANSFLAASAYLNLRGLKTVLDPIKQVLKRRGEVSVVHGFYPQITEVEAIRQLAELEMDFESMRYRVYLERDRSAEGAFHPKLYLTSKPKNEWHAVIGSSNLTRGGLTTNTEANCVLQGSAQTALIRDCLKTFRSIESNQNLYRPTAEWIETYERLREHELQNQKRSNDEVADVYENLFELSQEPTFQPKTQTDCVVQALRDLEAKYGVGTFHHLKDIEYEAWRISGGRYTKTNWDASVRHVLNANTIWRAGKQLFERKDGDKGHSGIYRLSDNGRRHSNNA